MMPLHRIVVAAMATITLARPLSAQAGDSLGRAALPGDTVRLHDVRMVLVQGVLARRDSTGLVVVDRRTRDTVQIPIFQIAHAEAQRGVHQRGARAVVTGMTTGALIGGVFLAAAVTSSEKDRGLGIYIAGLFTGLTTTVGAVIGAIVSITHTETWVSFDPVAVPAHDAGSP